jgi:hypothetical protein
MNRLLLLHLVRSFEIEPHSLGMLALSFAVSLASWQNAVHLFTIYLPGLLIAQTPCKLNWVCRFLNTEPGEKSAHAVECGFPSSWNCGQHTGGSLLA